MIVNNPGLRNPVEAGNNGLDSHQEQAASFEDYSRSIGFYRSLLLGLVLGLAGSGYLWLGLGHVVVSLLSLVLSDGQNTNSSDREMVLFLSTLGQSTSWPVLIGWLIGWWLAAFCLSRLRELQDDYEFQIERRQF